jgi:hypothetical protein
MSSREEKLKPFTKSKSELRRLVIQTQGLSDKAFNDYIEKKKNLLRKNGCKGCEDD